MERLGSLALILIMQYLAYTSTCKSDANFCMEYLLLDTRPVYKVNRILSLLNPDLHSCVEKSENEYKSISILIRPY